MHRYVTNSLRSSGAGAGYTQVVSIAASQGRSPMEQASRGDEPGRRRHGREREGATVRTMADQSRIRTFTLVLVAYPVALIVASLGLNLFALGVEPMVVALPAREVIWALGVAGALLALNHTWLMTTTELTRLNYGMYASHEEWAENDARKEDVVDAGWTELERRHSAHRNATENTVYFVFLAIVMSIGSPSTLAAQVWIVGFASARLGYTLAALRGRSGWRGVFMSLSLLAVYGLASSVVVGLML